MRREGNDHSPVSPWTSYGVALVLVLAGGTGYRMAAARYERSSTSVPIPKGTLSRLPMTIGEWKGQDVPISERIIKATDTDDHVNRTYQRSPKDVVSLWVAYGVHLRDLMPHRPEVCYVSSGWTMVDSSQLHLKLSDGQELGCRLIHFRRGGLDTEAATVLNYYLVDGQYCPDVSLLRSRASQFNAAATYSAQVQITVIGENLNEREDQLLSDFAGESAPLIRSLLTEAVRQAASQPS